MIIYGSGGGQAVLGEAGRHECPGCGQESLFNAVVQYSYFHIWYLFSFLTKRRYFVVCSNCGNAAPVDAKATRAQFRRDHIPFIRKRGWLLVVGLVAAFIAIGAAGDSKRSAARLELLAAPRVNDLYFADLTRVEGSGFSPTNAKGGKAYGLLKLREIDGDDLVFVTSMNGWNKKRGVTKELEEKGSRVAYDHDAPVTLSRERTRQLHDQDIIYDIRRR